MLVCVPDPVCQTRSGKCSSSLPATISSAARTIRPVRSSSSLPRSRLTSAADLLQRRHRVDDLARHHVARPGAVADVEVNQRARRLRAVVLVGGYLDLAHRVALDANRPGPFSFRHRHSPIFFVNRRLSGRPAAYRASFPPLASRESRKSSADSGGRSDFCCSADNSPACAGACAAAPRRRSARSAGCSACSTRASGRTFPSSW